MSDYRPLPSLVAGDVITASYLNELNDNLRVISEHAHTGASGQGSGSIVSASAASPFCYRYEAQAFVSPSHSNWSTSANGNYLFGYQNAKTLGSAASIKFPVGLYRGTYIFRVMHDDSVSNGSAIVLLSGSTLGTITNNGAASPNRISSITASVASTASYVFELDTAAGTNFRFSSFNIAMSASA